MAKTSSTPSAWRGPVRRDQAYALALGVALLACSALLHGYLNSARTQGTQALIREDPESEKTLAALAVQFPRLTLGGMRGLLSTVLWIQAEENKNDRKWLDLETKYDIIGRLQPYFASVYIYHSWNQAYNLSAQWQEQDQKYKWVIDGISYLYKGEDYNPNNPDILLELGHLYFLKLGNAFERVFYRQHWRRDLARLHELNDATQAQTDATVALKHVREFIHRKDAATGESNFHIEEMTAPAGGAARGYGVAITAPPMEVTGIKGFLLFKDRKDNKLATDPVEFRFGVSPFYFAFCEYKRMLALSVPPTYTGLRVMDAWPAMSLRMWCRDDLYFTGLVMRELFAPKANPAVLTNDYINYRTEELRDCARNIDMIAPRAVDLFNAHLTAGTGPDDPVRRYPENRSVHSKHILETEAYAVISKAEFQLFKTLVDWHFAGRKITPQIREDFLKADRMYQESRVATMKWVDHMFPKVEGAPVNTDRDDYTKYDYALEQRSKGIQALLNPENAEKPDMAFLEMDVIER